MEVSNDPKMPDAVDGAINIITDVAKEPITDEAKTTEPAKTETKPEHKPLTEKDVGILEYAGNHKGFFAILKQRYSDFLVNEIDTGNVVRHITDVTTIPTPPGQSSFLVLMLFVNFLNC